MAESTTVVTLKAKRADIEARIKTYEYKLAEARCHLAHINGAIAIFDHVEEPSQHRIYMSVHRLWERGEMVRIIMDALHSAPGPLTTTELAEHAMGVKGLDATDHVLRRGIADYMIHTLRKRMFRGEVVRVGKRNNRVILWDLPAVAAPCDR